MSVPPPIPPEPTLVRQEITKPDGRRLVIYTFVSPPASPMDVPPSNEPVCHVGTALEPPAG